MAKNVDPYADFASPAPTQKNSGFQGGQSNLNKGWLAVVILGAVIALVSGLYKLAHTHVDVSTTAGWGPVAGVALGFVIAAFAAGKVKKY